MCVCVYKFSVVFFCFLEELKRRTEAIDTCNYCCKLFIKKTQQNTLSFFFWFLVFNSFLFSFSFLTALILMVIQFVLFSIREYLIYKDFFFIKQAKIIRILLCNCRLLRNIYNLVTALFFKSRVYNCRKLLEIF